MGTLIELRKFKAKRKKAYMRRNGRRLDKFMKEFVAKNFQANFKDLSDKYLACRISGGECTWDYTELRERICRGIETSMGEKLIGELSQQWWFDIKLFEAEELYEECLTVYILASG